MFDLLFALSVFSLLMLPCIFVGMILEFFWHRTPNSTRQKLVDFLDNLVK